MIRCRLWARRSATVVSLVSLLVGPLALSVAPLSPPSAWAQGATAKAVKPNAATRKKIVDALRVPVAKELKQPVIFEITRITTQNGWAFLTGITRQPNGKPINYAKTPYAEQQREGMFDDGFCALLRKGASGKWKVVTYNIGATDVQWMDWDQRFRAPKSLFDVR